MKNVICVVGARPNFMKVAPIVREMEKYPEEFRHVLVHTGQHYDTNMSQVFFDDLGLPKPEIFLGVGSASHAKQTARTMEAFEQTISTFHPDLVIVVGDVNSTLACALTSTKLGVKTAHVEAGLRSFDRSMPEEINRIVTDHISDLLFTTEPSANENLSREGIPPEKVVFVGNVMIDTLVALLPKAQARGTQIKRALLGHNGTGDLHRYALVTLHRPSNVDDLDTLNEIVLALKTLAQEMPVLFPVHPRTRPKIKHLISDQQNGNVSLLDLLGYLDFLALMAEATLVVTDSGGVQEETTYLRVPCVTVRNNTERPITITQGTNRLVAGSKHALISAFFDSINGSGGQRTQSQTPHFWDGRASQRIVRTLSAILKGQSPDSRFSHDEFNLD